MQLVIISNEKVTTTSLLIAKKFGKEHKNVLQSIQQMECSPEFSRLHFKPREYINRGRKYTMYEITKDGFLILVMGFTGVKAMSFKEEYIGEFNRMEDKLREPPKQYVHPLETYTKRVLSNPTKLVPTGYWSIFDLSHSIMLYVERNIGSTGQYDLVDGSIGIRWAKYRDGKDWTFESSTYPHIYDDKRGTVICKCYNNKESGQFMDWLPETYKKQYLLPYMVEKFKKENNLLMLDKAQQLLPKLLKAY